MASMVAAHVAAIQQQPVADTQDHANTANPQTDMANGLDVDKCRQEVGAAVHLLKRAANPTIASRLIPPATTSDVPSRIGPAVTLRHALDAAKVNSAPRVKDVSNPLTRVMRRNPIRCHPLI